MDIVQPNGIIEPSAQQQHQRYEQGNVPLEKQNSKPIREAVSNSPDGYQQGVPLTAQDPPRCVAEDRSQEERKDDDYDESQDPDALEYWLHTAQDKPHRVAEDRSQEERKDDDYDESQDPDALEYWLQTAHDKPRRVSEDRSQEEKKDDDYDELQDPDALEYWLRRLSSRGSAKLYARS